MSEHLHEDELEERDDVVERERGGDEKKPDPGEPWAKLSSGDKEHVTDDE
jgi:hypothetical protein